MTPFSVRSADVRRFLLLQGPIGPFFADLQSTLHAAGHEVLRICFNGGDRLYAGSTRNRSFRGDAASWTVFVDAVMVAEGTTDLVLFGDCRPLHRQAIERARERGLRVHVFEEGYLRPGWITLEEGGVNGYSALLGEKELHSDSFKPAVGEAPAAAVSFARRAVEDVMYTAATALANPVYRRYRTHKPWHPLAEYRAGARRFFGTRSRRAQAEAMAEALCAQDRPFFLFPLQLDADAQIRVHSPFGRMQRAIETVIASFARQAPAEALLVVSEHPLDQGVVDLRPVTRICAAAAGVAERVLYVCGGTPTPLLTGCVGMVTVNSTMGLTAIERGCPVAVLGKAVYAIPGLVHGGPLDSFWEAPVPPDMARYAALRTLLIERTQIRGGFYAPAARAQAIEGAVRRLLGHRPKRVSLSRLATGAEEREASALSEFAAIK